MHRMLQKLAKQTYREYRAEVALKETILCADVRYTVEGRADGIFTDADGVSVIDEIKTTLLPADRITENHAPEHWGQGEIYAALYAQQQNLSTMRVQLRYYQIDEEKLYTFTREYTKEELRAELTALLEQYAPWAIRAEQERQERDKSIHALAFPFATYRPGQRAMIRQVYDACLEKRQLLCQAPTGIGKTVSVLFPALKSLCKGVEGPIFYLTARGTTHAAAMDTLTLLHKKTPQLRLRSLSLTAKDKICLCEGGECTADACPYASGYYDRIKSALWSALDEPMLTADTLCDFARRFTVCPYELSMELCAWSDVMIADYNYLFDPVVRLRCFFDHTGDYLFLVDEAHNLPERARMMHSASISKSQFYAVIKLMGKGKGRLRSALRCVNQDFIAWRHRCEEAVPDSRGKKGIFQPSQDEVLIKDLTFLCEPLRQWLEQNRSPSEMHSTLLELYFSVLTWLRTADDFDAHYVLQAETIGHDVRITQLCLDPSAFLAADFARGRAAILYSATLGPAAYYKEICGVQQANAVSLPSPFPQEHLGLFCASDVSTRYRDRQTSAQQIAAYLATLVCAKPGNYLAFFPSYQYLNQIYEIFTTAYPAISTLRQESGLSEQDRRTFLNCFSPNPKRALLGFAVLGGLFGESVDLTGERLIGVAIVGPGLPQVNAQQEQLRRYFEQKDGSGFDYAYRYPGMNKVLQAAGRLLRTPEDRGVVLLLDDRFASPAYHSLMPSHWSHIRNVVNTDTLRKELFAFWHRN